MISSSVHKFRRPLIALGIVAILLVFLVTLLLIPAVDRYLLGLCVDHGTATGKHSALVEPIALWFAKKRCREDSLAQYRMALLLEKRGLEDLGEAFWWYSRAADADSDLRPALRVFAHLKLVRLNSAMRRDRDVIDELKKAERILLDHPDVLIMGVNPDRIRRRIDRWEHYLSSIEKSAVKDSGMTTNDVSMDIILPSPP